MYVKNVEVQWSKKQGEEESFWLAVLILSAKMPNPSILHLKNPLKSNALSVEERFCNAIVEEEHFLGVGIIQNALLFQNTNPLLIQNVQNVAI